MVSLQVQLQEDERDRRFKWGVHDMSNTQKEKRDAMLMLML